MPANFSFILIRFGVLKNLSKVIDCVIWCQILCWIWISFAPPDGLSALAWPILCPQEAGCCRQPHQILLLKLLPDSHKGSTTPGPLVLGWG